MKKVLGIFGVLVVVCVGAMLYEPKFFTSYNLQNIIRLTSLFGIISIAVAFVIITGGIDLSIGSQMALTGCMFPWLLAKGWSIGGSLVTVMALALMIGLVHGLLITKARLQPFIVTLCGLLIYRGMARWMTGDQTQGFGQNYDALRYLAIGQINIPGITGFTLPVPSLILLGLAVVSAIFLNLTIWGRYLLALGRNSEAARLSGINTNAMVIVAYVLCSGLTGIAGILFALDLNSIQPSGHGNFYELYAIAAAVLGGCSLRGGEGSILGVLIGTALMRVLYNAINVLGIPTQLEYSIIGMVILIGALADELIRYLNQRRKTPPEAAAPMHSSVPKP